MWLETDLGLGIVLGFVSITLQLVMLTVSFAECHKRSVVELALSRNCILTMR